MADCVTCYHDCCWCRGKYTMSLLSAPVTSPLHAVELGLAQQRTNGHIIHGVTALAPAPHGQV